jgi:hypothetical protein
MLTIVRAGEGYLHCRGTPGSAEISDKLLNINKEVSSNHDVECMEDLPVMFHHVHGRDNGFNFR